MTAQLQNSRHEGSSSSAALHLGLGGNRCNLLLKPVHPKGRAI